VLQKIISGLSQVWASKFGPLTTLLLIAGKFVKVIHAQVWLASKFSQNELVQRILNNHKNECIYLTETFTLAVHIFLH